MLRVLFLVALLPSVCWGASFDRPEASRAYVRDNIRYLGYSVLEMEQGPANKHYTYAKILIGKLQDATLDNVSDRVRVLDKALGDMRGFKKNISLEDNLEGLSLRVDGLAPLFCEGMVAKVGELVCCGRP